MQNFVALGCVEVGEKFSVVILIPTSKLHQPEVGLCWAVTIQSPGVEDYNPSHLYDNYIPRTIVCTQY